MNIQIELSDKDKEDIANRLLHKMITVVAQSETFNAFQDAVKNEANLQAKITYRHIILLVSMALRQPCRKSWQRLATKKFTK